MLHYIISVSKNIFKLVSAPILTAIVPLLYSRLVQPALSEKDWRNIKKENSVDKYMRFQCKILLIYFISVILFFCLGCIFLYRVLQKEIEFAAKAVDYAKIILEISVITNIVIFILILVKSGMKDRIIKFKNNIGKKTWISNMMFYLPFITEGVAFEIDLRNGSYQVTFIGLLVLMILYIVIAIIMLDHRDCMEYKYISFELKNGTKIEGVPNERVKKKGSWIILKEQSDDEIRIRYEEVVKILYSNTLKLIKVNGSVS